MIVIILLVISFFISIGTTGYTVHSLFFDNDKNSAKILFRQSARWANAAMQDESPLISMLHANYAAGYLWALKDLHTDQEIEKETGIPRRKIEEKITEAQKFAARRTVEYCPQFLEHLDPVLSEWGTL